MYIYIYYYDRTVFIYIDIMTLALLQLWVEQKKKGGIVIFDISTSDGRFQKKFDFTI